MFSCHQRPAHQDRRGAVAVEFAIVAPFLVGTVLGLIQVTRIYDAQNLLETAAREGARFAAMEHTDVLADGSSANAKLIADVKNFLASTGIDPAAVQVEIVHADSPETPFDLNDPANDLLLFEVEINVPFSAISYTPVNPVHDYMLTASIVFRNGHATLSQ